MRNNRIEMHYTPNQMEKNLIRNILKPLIFLLLCFVYTNGFAQQWAVTYNSPFYTDNNGEDKAYSIAAGDSCVFVTGFSLGQYGNDILTIRYDLEGDTVWTYRYNGAGNDDDRPCAIAVDASNNSFVTGYTTGINTNTDIVTIKYLPDGDTAWVAIYNGSGNDRGLSICTDNANNVYVGGYVTDSAGSFFNFIILKYSFDGLPMWEYEFNGSGNGNDIAYAITLDGNNKVVATGSTMNGQSQEDIFTVKLNFDTGDSLYASVYNGHQNLNDKAYAITVDPLDNIIITGITTRSAGNSDIITIKYNPQCDTLWTAIFNGTGNSEDIGRSICITDNNIIIVGGSSRNGTMEGTEDYVLLRYNTANGEEVWNKTFDGAGHSTDIAYSIAVSEADNAAYITGSSRSGSTSGTEDMVTVKYQISSGSPLDTAVYDGESSEEDIAYDIAVDAIGNVYVTGFTNTSGGLDNPFAVSTDYLTLKYHKGQLIGTQKNSNGIPLNYNLYQNYPNPFNPVTVIKFDAPKAGQVKITVYDILGREVANLFDSYVQPGEKSIMFNGSGLASGIYLYELRTEDFRDIKKMVLIK